MHPRRTPTSNKVFRLAGGNEDNDLWVNQHVVGNQDVVDSVWELDEEERRAVAEGANIELRVFGAGTPPVAVSVTHEPLGRDGNG